MEQGSGLRAAFTRRADGSLVITHTHTWVVGAERVALQGRLAAGAGLCADAVLEGEAIAYARKALRLEATAAARREHKEG